MPLARKPSPPWLDGSATVIIHGLKWSTSGFRWSQWLTDTHQSWYFAIRHLGNHFGPNLFLAPSVRVLYLTGRDWGHDDRFLILGWHHAWFETKGISRLVKIRTANETWAKWPYISPEASLILFLVRICPEVFDDVLIYGQSTDIQRSESAALNNAGLWGGSVPWLGPRNVKARGPSKLRRQLF